MTIYTKDDFKSQQEVKWCPGCGDYAILATLQKTLPLLDIPKENFVFISGIGCSGRLPYYLDAFGFHTLHGRAPTVATGLKLTRPELSIWIVIGDGDGLSIGSNHLLHVLRRNVDINILFINNKIYGLTKGQYSPTSDIGTVSPTSPLGSIESPVNPIAFALAAGATFIARVIDTDSERLQKILIEATLHKGSAFIEIYQNCYIFNNDAFLSIRDKKNRADNCLFLMPHSPLLFGENNKKALVLNKHNLEVKEAESISSADLIIHDPENDLNSYLLSSLPSNGFPRPMGIIKKISKPTYGYLNANQDKANLLELCEKFINQKTPLNRN